MANEQTKTLAQSLADRWWVPLIRGLVAIAFGVVALSYSTISLLLLVWVWGAYAIADGLFNLGMAIYRQQEGGTWGWLVAEGILGIGAGVVAFAWPGMTALILVMVIAAWAVLTGITSIAAAIRLRKEIEGEWLLAASGVVSLVFGGLLFAYPGTGALAMLGVIGAFSLVFGVVLLALSWRLFSLRGNGRQRSTSGSSRMARV